MRDRGTGTGPGLVSRVAWAGQPGRPQRERHLITPWGCPSLRSCPLPEPGRRRPRNTMLCGCCELRGREHARPGGRGRGGGGVLQGPSPPPAFVLQVPAAFTDSACARPFHRRCPTGCAWGRPLTTFASGQLWCSSVWAPASSSSGATSTKCRNYPTRPVCRPEPMASLTATFHVSTRGNRF